MIFFMEKSADFSFQYKKSLVIFISGKGWCQIKSQLVPRHDEIDERLAENIIKELE